MKFSIVVFLVCASLLGLCHADPEVFNCGDSALCTLDEQGTMTVTGSGDMKNYDDNKKRPPWYHLRMHIKSLVVSDGVTSVGEYAFFDCSFLASVSFGRDVQTIGKDAFWDCSSLNNVVLPEGLTIVEERCFSHCSSLSSITMPSMVNTIKDSAFYKCTNLKTVDLSQTVSIKGEAFAYCTGLESISIPDSVEEMTGAAFHGCISLETFNLGSNSHFIKDEDGRLLSVDEKTLVALPSSLKETITTFSVPNTLEEIGDYAFSDCTKLETVTFTDSVKIGAGAFHNCSSLDGVQLPTSLTVVAAHSFEYCTSLSSIAIPQGVTIIGEAAFSECHNLESVDLSGVEEIGKDAFAFCALKIVSIPSSLIQLGESPFRGCKELEKFEMAKDGHFTVSDEGILFNEAGTELMAFPPALKIDSYTVPDKVDTLSTFAFSWNRNLKDITLTNSKVTKIFSFTFEECSSLEHVYLPEGLKSMQMGVFRGSSLKSIKIPNSVNGIGRHAFSNCKQLTDVELPDSMTWVTDHFFDGCVSLKTLTIPPNVDTVHYHAFWGCSSLETVWFYGAPENEVVNTSGDAFEGCPKLDVICVTEEYKFEHFCGKPVSTTCKTQISSSSSSSFRSSSYHTSSTSSPSSSHHPSASVLSSIPSLALLLASSLLLLF